ncbi:MAG: hypothetical protein ACYC11_11590, partial [Bellilinea sp.]
MESIKLPGVRGIRVRLCATAANAQMLLRFEVFQQPMNDIPLDWLLEGEAYIEYRILLDLWSGSATRHPCIFYMGTDFRKLKGPFIWYDLMHVLECLSQFNGIKQDPRTLEMARLLKDKADDQGR